MKPVQLLPSQSPVNVAAASAPKPNFAAIGGFVGGTVLLVAVSGYFAMAHVDSVKSEAAKSRAEAAAATEQETAVRSQIASLGQPVVDSDEKLADGAEQVFISAYTERHHYELAMRELSGIMDGTGGWYDSVEIKSSAGGDSGDSKEVKIKFFMPSEKLAASFNERLNATASFSLARTTSLKSVIMSAKEAKAGTAGRYWEADVVADFDDLVAPSANPGDVAGTTNAAGTIVAGGDAPTQFELQLAPKYRAPARRTSVAPVAAAPVVPKKPAAPVHPLSTAAASAASQGAS